MAAATDVLVTVFQVDGLSAWSNAFGQAERVLNSFKFKLDETGRNQAILAAGAAAGAGLIFGGLAKATQDAASEQETYNRAAGNFKGAFPASDVAALSARMQELTGVADDQVGAFVGLLGTFQATRGQAETLALPILNAAEALKAQGVTTEQLAVQVGKALQTGEPTALKRSGIILDEVAFKAADAEGRVRLLATALQGQGGDAAEKFRQSLGGSFQALQNSLGDVSETIGGPFVGGLTGAANVAEQLARSVAGLPTPVLQGFAYAAVAVAVALTGVSIALTVSVVKAGLMAGKNAELTRSALLAADALKAEANAANQAGGALQNAGGKTGGGGLGGNLKGGLLGGIAGFLLNLGGGALNEAGNKGKGPLAEIESATGFVAQRAGTGAAFGSIFGGPGAIVGGLLGGIEGALETAFHKPGTGFMGQQPKADPVLDELKKQTDLLKQQTDSMGDSGFADSHLAPISIQRQLTRGFAKQTRV